MEAVVQSARHLPIEEDDLNVTVAQLTIAIQHNIALLKGLVESRRPQSFRSLLSVSHDFLSVVNPDLMDVGGSTGLLQEHFLKTRVALWQRILAAPNPHRALIRWLKHLEGLTNGTQQCATFTHIFLPCLLLVFG